MGTGDTPFDAPADKAGGQQFMAAGEDGLTQPHGFSSLELEGSGAHYDAENGSNGCAAARQRGCTAGAVPLWRPEGPLGAARAALVAALGCSGGRRLDVARAARSAAAASPCLHSSLRLPLPFFPLCPFMHIRPSLFGCLRPGHGWGYAHAAHTPSRPLSPPSLRQLQPSFRHALPVAPRSPSLRQACQTRHPAAHTHPCSSLVLPLSPPRSPKDKRIMKQATMLPDKELEAQRNGTWVSTVFHIITAVIGGCSSGWRRVFGGRF